ncbi:MULTISPECIES: hypothetical protein [Mycolicibacterium]|uniref:hypothetical protein n=1 Tax=Mycolicibacterium TaxID=1866885 RepID=UPI002602E0D3|nr:hypothetical protein [Mycolicibacterium fortuitum]
MKIHVRNSYSDGHKSEQTHTIDEFDGDPNDEEALDEFLMDYTGDGHGIDRWGVDSTHVVKVLESEHRSLVGRESEYSG